MPVESTTRVVNRSAGVGKGHIKRRGVWVEGKISSALCDQVCAFCSAVIAAGDLLTKAGSSQTIWAIRHIWWNPPTVNDMLNPTYVVETTVGGG